MLCLALMHFGYCQAQKHPLAIQSDSLYQQGNFTQAAQSYHSLVAHWQTLNLVDSIHYYQLWEAKSHIQQYNYTQARAILESISAHPRAETNKALLSKVYHETGYTFLGEGEITKALTFSKKSIDTELSRAQVDTFQLAKYYELKGYMLMQSGEYAEAEAWVNKAHQLRKSVLDPLDKELGYSANTLYIVLDALGKLHQADTVISEAWHILNHHLPEDHPHIAVLANNYSSHLIAMGDPQQAKEYLLKAIASNRQGERYIPLMGNYVNLGLLFLNLNETKTAASYYQQAWEMADSLLAYPHYQRANIQDAMGAAFYQQKDYDEADYWFNAAYAEKKEVYDTDSEEIAQSLYNLGLIEQGKEVWTSAAAYFQQAASIRAKILGANHPKRADALFELGQIAWKTNQTKEGIAYWHTSLDIYQQQFGLAHHHSLENLIQLVEAFDHLDLPDSVQHYLQLAWAGACGRNDKLTDFDQLNTLSLSQYHPFVLALGNLHLRLLLDKGNDLTQKEVSAALAVFKIIQTWIPTFQSLYNDALLWENVAAQVQDFYRQSAVLAYRQLTATQKDTILWQNVLLNCIQASRGTTIRAAFKDRQAVQFAGIPDSLIEQGQTLKQQLQFALSRQQNEQSEEEHTQFNLQQQSILQSWLEYQQMLKQAYPQYYQARFAFEPITLETIQPILKAQHYSVLAYLNLDSTLLAVHVEADKLRTVWLPMPDGWQDSLQHYQQLIQSQEKVEPLSALSYFLYQQLWLPLSLPAQSTINILPDGPLYYLNFETLLSRKPDELDAVAKWPWLIRDFNLYYGYTLPGSSISLTDSQGKVLGIAPGFSQSLKNEYLNSLSLQQQPDSIFLQWVRTPWSLDFVEQLQAKNLGVSLTEQSATETLFLKHVSQASVLHFGTHARLENEKPLYSFLALMPEPSADQDGYLYTYELYNRPLQANLAVLTACETGLGEYRRGEGVLSLAQAFRYAGCPSVIYSLWSIDDQHTNEIVDQFYDNLIDEMAVAEALRAAKLSYLDQVEGNLQSPYYWAGLVLSGENSPVVLSSPQQRAWILGLSGGLLLLLVFVLTRMMGGFRIKK